MSTKTEFMNTPELGVPKLPLSHAAIHGDYIFLSGQFGLDPQTGALSGADIDSQTHQTFKNIEATLRSLGRSFGDVIKCNVYLTDMGNFQAMNQIYGSYFKAPYPARTTVGVVGLPMGALVEIEMLVAQG